MSARRLAELLPSPIRVLSEGAPPDAIPLGIGEPTWDLPAAAREALAHDEGPCPYGPNAGLPELRAAIAVFHGTVPERVLVTAGSSGALFALFQAWLDRGDEALVPDPGFPAYAALARLCEAEPRTYALDATDRYRIDPAAFTRALDAAPRARLAIVNQPSNPTGGSASRESLHAIADACEARGVLLVSDEVYRDLYFGERPPTLGDVSTRGVVVSSTSKGFGAPGLRIGWAVGDPEWLAPARIVHGYAVTATTRPAQLAARALLERADEILPDARREVERRFVALASALERYMGRRAEPPDGGFYHWIALPDRARDDPLGFCCTLRDEARVVVVPGFIFGERGRGHARLSFAAPPEVVAEGVRRLAPFWT